MWIDLSDTLPGAFAVPDLQVLSVLEAIATASFHGRHVLYGSTETLRWLANLNISGPAKAAVSRAMATGAEKGSMRAAVRTKLIIESGEGVIAKDVDGNWRAPIQRMIGVPMLSVEVLAENTRDVEALKFAALHYRQVNNLRGVGVALMAHNGGGTEILNCFRGALAAREKFTCAVTDSDKDHPTAESGHISKGCALEHEAARWICNHFELPVREMENILPFNLVHDSITASAENADLFNPLAEILNAANRRPDILKYMDMKEGTTGSTSTAWEANVARRNFWAGIVNDCLVLDRLCGDNCARHPCECKIVPGIGPQVLQRFLDYCNIISVPKQVERMKTSHHWEDWLAVGARIFDWTQADQPLRV